MSLVEPLLQLQVLSELSGQKGRVRGIDPPIMTRIGQIFALDESKYLQIQYIIKEDEEVLSLLAKQVMDEIFILSAYA